MNFDNQEEDFEMSEKKSKIENLETKKNFRSTESDKIKSIFSLISIIAGIIALLVLIHSYVVRPTEKTFGERLVLDHFRLDTPIYNFHFKPITLIVIFTFIFSAFGLESLYTVISTKSLLFKKIMFIFFFTLTFIFFFEVFQNFIFWYAVYVINLGKINPDILDTGLTPSKLIVNFNAMTKFYTLIFFLSIYGLLFFYRMLRKEPY